MSHRAGPEPCCGGQEPRSPPVGKVPPPRRARGPRSWLGRGPGEPPTGRPVGPRSSRCSRSGWARSRVGVGCEGRAASARSPGAWSHPSTREKGTVLDLAMALRGLTVPAWPGQWAERWLMSLELPLWRVRSARSFSLRNVSSPPSGRGGVIKSLNLCGEWCPFGSILGGGPRRGLLPGLHGLCLRLQLLEQYGFLDTPSHVCGSGKAGSSSFWNVLYWLAPPSGLPRGGLESRTTRFPGLG